MAFPRNYLVWPDKYRNSSTQIQKTLWKVNLLLKYYLTLQKVAEGLISFTGLLLYSFFSLSIREFFVQDKCIAYVLQLVNFIHVG